MDGQSRWHVSQAVVVIYSFFVSIILWVTLYHLRGTTKLLLRSLFFFFFLLLVMLTGFVERKDGLQHEFTKPGIHAGSTLLMDNSVFYLLKKKSLTAHFVSDELFSTWEKDKMCLQEAVGQTVSNGHIAERSNSKGSFIMSFMSLKM